MSLLEVAALYAKNRLTIVRQLLFRAAVEASLPKLTEYRSSLISAAVTGQIDVRTYRPEEADVLCQ